MYAAPPTPAISFLGIPTEDGWGWIKPCLASLQATWLAWLYRTVLAVEMDSTVTTIIDESAPPAKKPRLTDDPTAAPRPQNGDKTTHHTREEDVGISQYISPHPGIFAILKQRCVSSYYQYTRSSTHPHVCRYSDFIVHELALDGSMVQLTSFDLPPDLPAPASVSETLSLTVCSLL